MATSLSSPAPASRKALRAQERTSRRSRLTRGLALGLSVTLALATVVATNFFVGESAVASDRVQTSLSVQGSSTGDGSPFVVAGDTFTLSMHMENTSNPEEDLFNAAFTLVVPVGLEFVSGNSLLGAPRVIVGNGSNGAPVGAELWVWEDVADLPAGASLTGAVEVRPAQPTPPGTGETDDVTVFPVGALIWVTATAWASDDARLLPVFAGSTGGAPNADHNAGGNPAVADLTVRALEVTKSEPSPEGELVRGVHDEHTTYTITVRNTTEGTTQNVVVVDYLPAGLEYLGGGGDNSTVGDEYVGSGSIGGSAPANYRAADLVETIVADAGNPDHAHLVAGEVYTKVTWVIGTMAAGETLPIQYLAAVPLFENTMDWAAGEPATDGAQAGNLDNNNGPSTREGTTDVNNPGDGVDLTNTVTIEGDYDGTVRTGTDRATTDWASMTVSAHDLAIIKSAPGTPFEVGGAADWTLLIRSGEYVTASDLVVVDTLPDGLFPRLPLSLASEFPGLPSEWFDASHPAVEGAVITDIVHDPVAGTVVLTFAPTGDESPFVLQPSRDHEIVYSVGMRVDYERDSNALGQTTAGDSFTNTVHLTGVTTPIDGVAGDTLYVEDVSSSTMGSGGSAISKEVAARDAITGFTVDGTPIVDDSKWLDGSTPETTPGGFTVGDTVVYRVQVQFPSSIDTRNPRVSDMLPQGVAFEGWAVGPLNTVPVAQITATVDAPRVGWVLGSVHSSGDRFVAAGSLLELYVWGEVTELSVGAADALTLDKPENLAKYRYENVHGEVFFSRDQAATLTEPGISLIKGVRDVDGNTTAPLVSGGSGGDGADFNSDRDGVGVVQTDKITYRIDLSSPKFETENLVVWDALPEGITASMVSDFSVVTRAGDPVAGFTASALDPADTGYPSDVSAAATGHSLVMWSIDAMAASSETTPAGLTLLYTVTVPVGVYISERLDNTASIVRYDAVSNTGADTDNVTIVPDSELSTTPASTDPLDRELPVPGTHTNDDSWVQLPNATIAKVRTATEIVAAQNSAAQAVQGEYITYRYTLTVPAHTTIPAGSTLADGGQLARNATMTNTLRPYTQVGSATLISPAAGPEYSLASDGTLTFDSDYDNTSDSPVAFTVEIVVYTNGSGFTHGNTLYNRATFTNAASSTTMTATASVGYRTIAPTLAKTVNGEDEADVTAGATVTFQLTAANPSSRPHSYDTVVVDCVPAELEDVTITVGSATVETDECADGGTLITWAAGDLAPGASVTLTYTAVVDPSSAGLASYTNVANLTGTTLPGDDPATTAREGSATAQADATVRIVPAVIEKLVSPEAGTIGDVFDYTVTVTLPEDVNFYDAVFGDDLPDGLEVIAGTVTVDSDDDAMVFVETINHNGTTLLEWSVHDGTAGTISAADAERTITLTYQARMVEYGAEGASPVRGNTLVNETTFDWRTEPGGDSTTARSVDDTATVTVTEPVLTIAKKVDGLDENRVALDDTFDYTVTVTNTGNANAHSIVVTDEVPTGVIVDASTISDGGVLTGASATTGGGTITWNLAGPLDPNDSPSIELTYTAQWAAAEHLDPQTQSPDEGWWTNTAAVTHYESHPDSDHSRDYDPTDVTDTARVAPLFPFVTLDKTVGSQGEIAYVDEAFAWQLTLRNTGAGAAQTVTAIDTLPVNWAYDAGSALVSIAGGTPTAIEPVVTGTVATGQTLTWVFGEAAPAAPVLAGAAGVTTQAIVITFTATPTEAVIDTPGIGVDGDDNRIPHTNELTADVTDVRDEPNYGGGEYVGPDADDDAFIHVADIELVKSGATTPLVAGEAPSTGWQLVVTNNGPNPADGPFTVTDVTDPLPDGVSVTGFTGAGWSLVSGSTDGDGVFTGVYSYGDADTTLASGASLPTLGLTVTVAADFDPADLPGGLIDNTATVESPTHDDDPSNNESGDDIEIVTVADLGIEKTVTTTSPQAGTPITWEITVTNHGPSDSRSSTVNPITVTDTIPAGVTGVTMPTLPTGWSSNIPVAGTLTAGDTLELTHENGGVLAAGTSVTFTVTGDILSSHTGSLTNTATVTPGETDEPDDPVHPNDDTETTPVDTSTSLGISKTRVVSDGAGGWVPATTDDDIVAGETVTYLIAVSNNGPADAVGVQVVDTLTDGLEAPVSHTAVSGTWTAGPTTATTFEFALTGNLVAGASASLRVTATVESGLTDVDPVVNTARVTATNDPDGDEDDDTGGPVRVADLTIAKSHDTTATPVAGGTLDYTIVVTNLGPSYSTGPIVITDTLPTGFSYVADSALVDGVAVNPTVSGQTLTWTVGDGTTSLANGDTITITLTTAIASTAAAGAYLNTATVSGPEDENHTNNTDTDEVTITTEAVVSILKVAGTGPYVAGDTVTYTLTVTNAGPSVARNVTVVDTPETGLTITGMSGSTGWLCDPDTAACAFTGDLPVGTSTITVTATIDSSVPDGTELDNEATVRWTDSDGPHEDDDDEPIDVTAIADLSIVKSLATGSALNAGETGRYRLLVSNHADASDAVTVTVTDALPAGLSYAGNLTSQANAWSYVGVNGDGDLEFALAGNLVAGASTWLEFDVAVDADVTGNVTNVATAHSPVDPDEPSDDETTTVGTTTNLSIVKKRTSTGDARIGDTTSFLVTVTNDGPAVATGVQVTDELQPGLTFVGVTTPATGADWSFLVVGEELTATLNTPLGVGASVSFTVTAFVDVGAYPSIDNTAEVEADNPETTYEDNESTVPVPVAPQVDLGIVKGLVSGDLMVGETATYRLTVTNHGVTDDPGPITVRDVLPVGLEYVSSDIAECDAVADEFECEITDTLPVGESFTIEFTVNVVAAAYPEVTNTATVSTESEDTNPDNDSSTVTDPVTPDVRFAIEKTVASSTDETVTWLITVTSIGLNDAFNGVQVTDTLPAELSYLSSSSTDGFVCEVDPADDQSVICDHPDVLPSGQSASFLLVTATTQAYGTSVTNVAEVTGGFITDPEEPVTDSDNHTRNLPVTGGGALWLISVGLLALAAGGVLVGTSRVRRPVRSTTP